MCENFVHLLYHWGFYSIDSLQEYAFIMNAFHWAHFHQLRPWRQNIDQSLLMCIATGKIHVYMKFCFDYCISLKFFRSNSSFKESRKYFRLQRLSCHRVLFFYVVVVVFLMDCSKLNLKSNYKSSDTLTGMSTTESTTTSLAHFLFHWMIPPFTTVVSNIIYKSCTGCFILFSVRMSSLITGYSF